MKNLTLIAAIGCMLSFMACKDTRVPERKPQLHDTLYTKEAAMDIYGKEPQRALLIIDSAVIVGNMTETNANLLRARIYGRNSIQPNFKLSKEICLRLLEQDEMKDNPNMQFEVLEQLIYVCRLTHDHGNVLKYANMLTDLCHEQGWTTEELRTQADIALTLSRIGRRGESIKMLDNCIMQLDHIRKFNEMDACVIAMKRKINLLSERDQEAEVIPVATRIIDIIDDYEQHPGDYDDGSPRIPEPNHTADYCDFYRSQAFAYLAHAYLRTADKQQARQLSDMFEQSNHGQTLEGKKMIADTWLELGYYDKLQKFYRDYEAVLETDTVNRDYAQILYGKAIIANAQGRNAESQDYWIRFTRLTDKLNDKLQESEAHDYAARYHEQERQIELQKKEEELRRMHIYFGAGFLIAVIAAAFAYYFFHQRRMVDKKNQVLIAQMAEASEYQDKYEQLSLSLQNQQPVTATTPANGDTDNRQTISEAELHNLSDSELYQYLSGEIKRERLFLNPDFGRQAVMDRFHISGRKVGAAFSQGSSHNSLPDFIRECRLQYACLMLNNHPDMSINDVATACGFSNASVFSRDFKHKFTVSPTAYRKQG